MVLTGKGTWVHLHSTPWGWSVTPWRLEPSTSTLRSSTRTSVLCPGVGSRTMFLAPWLLVETLKTSTISIWLVVWRPNWANILRWALITPFSTAWLSWLSVAVDMTSEGRSTAMWTKSYRVSQHTRQLSPVETRLLCKSWRWLVSRSPSKGRVRRRFCRRFKMALIWRALSLSIVSWTTVRLEKTRSLRPSLLRWEADSLYAPPLPRPLCLLACTFFWFVTQSILRDKSRTATLLLPSSWTSLF